MGGSRYINYTSYKRQLRAGVLLEPRLSKLRPNIIAALQCNRSYLRMGFKDLVDKVIRLPGLV